MTKYRGRFPESDAADVTGLTGVLVGVAVLLIASGVVAPTPWLRWPLVALGLTAGLWVGVRRRRGLDGSVRAMAKRLEGSR